METPRVCVVKRRWAISSPRMVFTDSNGAVTCKPPIWVDTTGVGKMPENLVDGYDAKKKAAEEAFGNRLNVYVWAFRTMGLIVDETSSVC